MTVFQHCFMIGPYQRPSNVQSKYLVLVTTRTGFVFFSLSLSLVPTIQIDFATNPSSLSTEKRGLLFTSYQEAEMLLTKTWRFSFNPKMSFSPLPADFDNDDNDHSRINCLQSNLPLTFPFRSDLIIINLIVKPWTCFLHNIMLCFLYNYI